MTPRLRAVFFDAGHTLLHPFPSVGELYALEAEALGVRVDPGMLGSIFSTVFAENEAALAADSMGARASDEQDAAMWRAIVMRVHERTPELRGLDAEAWCHRLYVRFGRSDQWRLYPEVEGVLKDLRSRGLKLGVISNWSTRLRDIARATGLEPLVDFIVASSEAGMRKPDPRIFRIALDRAGVAPDEAVHVGDQVEDDVRGAARMGIRPVLIWRKPGSPAGVDAGMILPDLAGLAESLFREESA
ncbi:MAG TPA: HAD-IA family hydrolase [Planctomycetota bacterium]|nr:HAD-IA family hydrolase [Planctomycetota bacterium]